MKGKSIAYQIIMASVMFFTASMDRFGLGLQVWLGLFTYVGTMLLQSELLATGHWPKGWAWEIWALNIAGIVISMFNYLGDHQIIDQSDMNYFIVLINLFLTNWVKTYATPNKLAE